MNEEKKEVESSEEDEEKESEKKEGEDSKKTSEEEGTSEEEEKEEEKEDFEKSEKYVPANKYNQSLRKLRESELEKRELEKKLQSPPTAQETPEKKEDEDKFFEDEEKEEEKKTPLPDPSEIIDEKLKPVLDSIKKREEEDHKKDRTAFFEAHSEYREDGEKWSGLLDTVDKYINPNSDESYYEQLNAAHILYTGQNAENIEVADKKREMAGDAASSGAGAQKAGAKEEFTSEDRKTMKDFKVSEEGMRAYKKKVESGSLQILG